MKGLWKHGCEKMPETQLGYWKKAYVAERRKLKRNCVSGSVMREKRNVKINTMAIHVMKIWEKCNLNESCIGENSVRKQWKLLKCGGEGKYLRWRRAGSLYQYREAEMKMKRKYVKRNQLVNCNENISWEMCEMLS
jgi:hypothetical protein